jgi:hypothetical protein
MPHHGLGLMAFDRETGQWQETWVDNFSARISLYTGKHMEGKHVVSGTDMYKGEKMYTRMTSSNFTDTSYDWMMENSMDGENWYTSMKGTYTKQ